MLTSLTVSLAHASERLGGDEASAGLPRLHDTPCFLSRVCRNCSGSSSSGRYVGSAGHSGWLFCLALIVPPVSGCSGVGCEVRAGDDGPGRPVHAGMRR